jgi:bacterial/archaeal transporter family-2 protein
MAQTVIGIVVSFAAGLSVAAQTGLMGPFGRRYGVVPSVTFTALGSAVSSVLLVAAFSGIHLDMAVALRIPIWMWGVGLLGAVYFSSVTLAVPRLGAAASIGFLIAGQLMIGFVVDTFGLFGVEQVSTGWVRIVGILLVASGALLAIWRKAETPVRDT